MSAYVSGHFQIGTISIAASGSAEISPLLADNVFRNPSITVVPKDGGPNYRYSATLYLDGILEETHNYTETGERNAAHMQFPNKVFPPNVHPQSHPEMVYHAGFKPDLAGFSLVIVNNEPEIRTFTVYSTFEMWPATAAKVLDFT